MLKAVFATVAAFILLPGVAHAYEVRVTLVGAGQVTESTTADLLGDTCVTSSTNPSGTVGKVCLAGTPSGAYGIGWDVDYVAVPKPGYRFVRWESDMSPRTGIVCDRSSPAATTTTYTGATCKFRTFEDLQTRVVFVDDTPPAMSTLAGPNQPVGGPATFSFGAASDPTFRRFECRVAGVHEWQACSPGTTENPPTGTYTFQVRAVDWSGNLSSEFAWTWTVDKQAPETTLAGSGPTGTFPSTSATFAFGSNEPATFVCSLDGATAPCESPKTYAGLGQGQHTFTVSARDALGNMDLSPASRTWTVDTVAAETVLDPSGPAGATTSTTATFTFTSEPGAEFNCRLDNQAIDTDCTSPVTYTALALGEHTFRVWARDAVGNTDASPSMRTWTVVAPTPGVAASPTSLAFFNQAVGTIGGATTITLTSNGQAPLTVERLRMAGANPEDFVNAADDCTGETIAPGSTCTVKVRFAPAAGGARSAVLRVLSDAVGGPVEIALSGTGTALSAGSAGPVGATGPAGPAGPAGPVGPQGRPGRDARVTCRTVKGKKNKVTCRVVYVAAKSAETVRARLSRNGRTLARLSVRSIARPRVTLRLEASRRLPAGRYQLVVVTGDGRGQTTVARHRVRLR